MQLPRRAAGLLTALLLAHSASQAADVLVQPVYPSAANGYYVMLRPLPPGRHTLNFGGVLPSMLQAVTYTLIVE